MEVLSVHFGEKRIEYSVARSNRKTVGVFVDPALGVLVRSPWKATARELNGIVKKKAPWILRRIAEAGRLLQAPSAREFVSGESFPYLGRSYRLKILPDGTSRRPSLSVSGRRLFVSISSRAKDGESLVRAALGEWYVSEARRRLEERVRYYAPKVGVAPTKIIIREQKKRWGSCTKRGEIILNWKIIMAPLSVIDYVVVHELCHLGFPTHSQQFWATVKSVLPDYDRRREWLRRNGAGISFRGLRKKYATYNQES